MMRRTATTITSVVCFAPCASASFAQDMPGKGVTVDPIKGSPANAWFQHMVVQLDLEALGYRFRQVHACSAYKSVNRAQLW